jgi:hypothetical protein
VGMAMQPLVKRQMLAVAKQFAFNSKESSVLI